MGKISLLGLFRAYFDTLRDANTERHSVVDIATQLVLPLLFGCLAGWFGFKIDMNLIVGGVSTTAALMCAVAVMLYQTRLNIPNQTEGNRPVAYVLVDELFADVVWEVAAGFLIVAIVMLVYPSFENTVVVGIIAGLLLHFLLVGLMCLKRISSVYKKLKD